MICPKLLHFEIISEKRSFLLVSMPSSQGWKPRLESQGPSRELTSWNAHYWMSRFRELWWEYRCYRGLLRVVKAFKLFFGLE
ncbi:MAG: hypothetical protein QW702_00010 [Candidatus Bathyarchaeia archaeon]